MEKQNKRKALILADTLKSLALGGGIPPGNICLLVYKGKGQVHCLIPEVTPKFECWGRPSNF